jgi:chemotaxis response regulator CheB
MYSSIIIHPSDRVRAKIAARLEQIPGFSSPLCYPKMKETAKLSSNGNSKVQFLFLSTRFPVDELQNYIKSFKKYNMQARIFMITREESDSVFLDCVFAGCEQQQALESDLTSLSRILVPWTRNRTITAKPGGVKSTIPKKAHLIVIGGSTGAPAVISTILSGLPETLKTPVVIVQHIRENFDHELVKQLQTCCKLSVKLASHNTKLSESQVWVAPAGKHLRIDGFSGDARLILDTSDPVHSCRPCIDYLFSSASEHFAERTLGIVLTGIGEDGLQGASSIVNAGGRILAQEKSTCAVWGIPKKVVESKLADMELSPEEISKEILRRI